jgi:two-component system LytT family response regulator
MIEYVSLGSAKILIKDILVIKGEGNYSNIFTHDGKRTLTCRTLKYFATILVEYQFIRPSKSALINPDSIQHIDFKSQKSIRLVNGDVISISRRNVRPLREQFQA